MSARAECSPRNFLSQGVLYGQKGTGVIAMRAVTSAVVGLVSATATCLYAAQAPAPKSPAAQGPPPAPEPAATQAPAKSSSLMPQMVVLPTVHLNGPDDLEHLRETNFYHYLRAKKILAAANEICRPKPEPTYLVRFSDAHPACGPMWMTSLPAKKLLRFRLDDVYYIAMVAVTYPAKIVKVDDQRAVKPR